jgi:hypothetical protein
MKNENYFATEAVAECISWPGDRVEGMPWVITRMRVPGGWLVTNVVRLNGVKETSISLSTIFVSDPGGGWKIDNEGFMRIAAEASCPQ